MVNKCFVVIQSIVGVIYKFQSQYPFEGVISQELRV